ncbi:MAG: alpha/beta fold hydrolase [Xanthomonadales bacterium]|nr:alpha/beta fold hydrolase [Xanthomonadales bacterium]
MRLRAGQKIPSLLTGLLLLVACTPAPRPDLVKLYGVTRQATDQPPVILVHGILGSRIRSRGEGDELWVGRLSKILFSDYEDLALSIDPVTLDPVTPDSEAFAITDQAAGTDFYGRIIETLESAGGYRPGVPGTPARAGERRYYVFVYDWRQDNVRSAAALDAYIDHIRGDYGDPRLKVDIVAHSMGGLLTRYYLRYGSEDVLNDNRLQPNLWGRDRVRRVILLGTPNLGSVNSVRGFIEGVKVGLGRIPTEVLATMPSVYQLFPHPKGGDWIATAEGKPLDRDVFSARIWRRFGWSVYSPEVRQRIRKRFDSESEADAYLGLLTRYFERHIERARRFVWSLTVRLEETPWQLIVLGGDCELTPRTIVVEEVDGKSMVRLRPEEIASPVPGVDYETMMLEPGDGTVTKSSLLARNSLDPTVPRHEYVFFPLDFAFFICESHDQLTGNMTFQDNLLHILLSR